MGRMAAHSLEDFLRRFAQPVTAPTTASAATEWLLPLNFAEPVSAARRLEQIANLFRTEGLGECLRQLILSLVEAAHPDQTLLNLERLYEASPDPAAVLAWLRDHPRAIDLLVRVTVGSQYLTETLIRRPELLPELTSHQRLSDIKSREEFIEAAEAAMGPAADDNAWPTRLRRYHRWELLRIGACDAFGLMDLKTATVQLSLLADAMIRVCLRRLDPQPTRGSLAVLGMGKLGGEELNYSSDIDLVFVCDEGVAPNPSVAQRLIKALQDSTAEGFLYRVDTRLRPWGRSGELVARLPAYLEYLAKHAELWEKQALLKARVVAGDEALGKKFLKLAEPLIYQVAPQAVQESIRQSKRQIEQQLLQRGKAWGEVKSGVGTIRDVEFTTQSLQWIHGGKYRHVRSPNTLDGLVRLADAGLIRADEYRQLTEGYVFLRSVEHALQLMHNSQTHSLPDHPRELHVLARRLDFPTAERFVQHYEQHLRAIRPIFERYLGINPPTTVTSTNGANATPEEQGSTRTSGDRFAIGGDRPDALLDDATDRIDYKAVFDAAERARHRTILPQLTPDNPVFVEAVPLPSGQFRLIVVGVDQPGVLSMICGLLFAHGFDITSGFATTGNHPDVLPKRGLTRKRGSEAPAGESLRDFADVFLVAPPKETTAGDIWEAYRRELADLMRLSANGSIDEAQGRLARRVAVAVAATEAVDRPLAPVEVELQAEPSGTASVLKIRADDTIGFLYELSNALALSGIAVERVRIQSAGNRVDDVLYVTDARHGGPLHDPDQQRQLQAAVVLIKQFTHLLPRSPNPEAALLHFRNLLQEIFRQPNWWEDLLSLDEPEVLSRLARILGVSDSLWEDFLRLQFQQLLPMLKDSRNLETPPTRREWQANLTAALAAEKSGETRRQALNQFKDRELFRCEMRHILGLTRDFEQFSTELTTLAEVVVGKTYELVYQELVSRFGVPRQADGSPVPLAILALGKFGGRELGFASDLELMFVYANTGRTDGPQASDLSSFYQRFVEVFRQAIRAKQEGIFDVDLRMRPFGKAGPLAIPCETFETYYAPDGPAWPYERQALIKLRPVAGSQAFGHQLEQIRDRLIYTGAKFDFAAMRALREKQQRQLVRPGTFNAKLSSGALVDVEYLVQALQITHGGEYPALRTTNTSEALRALGEVGVLTVTEGAVLTAAYQFFRRLIDALRMVRNNARDVEVPDRNDDNWQTLVRRLDYKDAGLLAADIEGHSATVLELLRNHAAL